MLAPPSPFSAASPFDTGKPVNPFGSQPKTGVGRSANLRRDGNAHVLMTPQARKTFLCAHTENSEKSLLLPYSARLFFQKSVFADKTPRHHFTFSGFPPCRPDRIHGILHRTTFSAPIYLEIRVCLVRTEGVLVELQVPKYLLTSTNVLAY